MPDDWQVVLDAMARLRARSQREESAHDLESEMLTIRYQQAEAEVAQYRQEVTAKNETIAGLVAAKRAADARVEELEQIRDWRIAELEEG